MRLPSDLHLKAGVIFGLLAVNLAAPLSVDKRAIRRDLAILPRLLIDPVLEHPVVEPEPITGTHPDSPGGVGELGGTSGGSGGGKTSSGSEVHLGSDTPPPETGGSSGDVNLGSGKICKRGSPGCGTAPPEVGQITQVKGQQLLDEARAAVENPNPATEQNLANLYNTRMSGYEAPIHSAESPLTDPLDQNSLSSDTKTWFKNNLGQDFSVTPTKTQVNAKGGIFAAFQGYVFADARTMIVTRTFRDFAAKPENEPLYYPGGKPAGDARIQMSEFIHNEYSGIAGAGTAIDKYIVGSIENTDAQELIKNLVQRASADPTKVPTSGDAEISAVDNPEDFNLLLASSAGKSFIRSIKDHPDSAMAGRRLPTKAFVRFGTANPDDFWIAFTM